MQLMLDRFDDDAVENLVIVRAQCLCCDWFGRARNSPCLPRADTGQTRKTQAQLKRWSGFANDAKPWALQLQQSRLRQTKLALAVAHMQSGERQVTLSSLFQQAQQLRRTIEACHDNTFVI